MFIILLYHISYKAFIPKKYLLYSVVINPHHIIIHHILLLQSFLRIVLSCKNTFSITV